MPFTAVAAALVVAQTVLLTIPWLAVRRTYYSPPDPLGNLDHARTARVASLCLDYPLSIGLVVLASVWIDHQHSVVLAIYLALITRVLVAAAHRARRSVPVLGAVFPWLLAPAMAWAAALVVATALAGDVRGWLAWLVGVALALALPAQLPGTTALVLRPVLVAAKRLRLRRQLRGRWVRSAGGWNVCHVQASDGDAGSPRGSAVTLAFSSGAALLPVPTGSPPEFLVEVGYNREWQPPEGSLKSLRLADYPGPGPIKEAMFAAAPYGIRAARARLDHDLVVVIEEVQLGGDDFFQFITSLMPAGRMHATEPDR